MLPKLSLHQMSELFLAVRQETHRQLVHAMK